jgi:Fe-S-cluster containining protein
MDYDEGSGLWISFKSGRRAMALRKRSGRCIFQTPARACTAYPARPQTCRTFPYSVYFADAKNTTIEEIRLNKILKCNALKCKEIDVDFLIDNVRKENREDRAYHKLVKQWNNQNKKGGALDFLHFIGF